MKKLIIFLCLFMAVTALYAKAIQEDYRKADEKAQLSYAFGMAIGSNFNLGEMGLEFNYDAFAQGLKDMVEDEQTQFSEQEAMELIETALQNASQKKSEQNRMAEYDFLTANMKRPEVMVSETGLQYEILKNSKGERPKEDSVVRVHYTGTFIDGKPFDSSSSDTDGAYIPLDMVIPGWAEGLLLMTVGSQYRLFIPSDLAYGSDGIQGIIPPYSTLIFTVELLEIVIQED